MLYTQLRGDSMTTKRLNVSVPENLYEEFYKYACKRGVSLSLFLQMKMQEFIKEEKEYEEYKRLKEEGKIKIEE